MDFNKTRCPMCFKHFCCSAHRSEHQIKCHTETFAQRHSNNLVTVFQQKAQSKLLRTQNHQEIANVTKQSQVTKASAQLPTAKRLHSAINKRILTTSVTVMSQQRRILVPVHRLKLFSSMVGEKKEVTVKDSSEVRKESPNVCVNESPYVDTNVKTSTPIISPLPYKTSSQITWNISSESTISNYQTPSGPSPDRRTDNRSNVKSTKGQVVFTPLRGIILKSSKYDSDGDTGPSPGGNTSSRSRRVTFSSSSQMSSTSTPLESIQEVEIYEELENTYNHIGNLSANFRSRYIEESESPKVRFIRKCFEDSTTPIRDNGFLSCMTNMFCSAIHTIPSLALWRKTETNSILNRSKRSRSPEEREALHLDIETPLLKRPCYPNDLRKNPIQSRRPISNK